MEESNKEHIHTPIELFGVECGKGWYKLLTPLFDYVKKYNKDKEKEEEKIHFTQIKEKWGLLCVYTDWGTDELFKLIDEAEEKSYNVCEFCGSEENIGSQENGWIITMCFDCAVKQAKERGYSTLWLDHSDNKCYFVDKDGNKELADEIE